MQHLIYLLIPLLLAVSAAGAERDQALDNWTDAERALIDSLLLDRLGPPPPDPSNRFADSPQAAALGENIFNDSRFSANGAISCSTCHRADYNFSDPLPRALGIGTMPRRSMPAMGMAWQKWFFWDGRSDSLWSQALEPIQNPLEHGIDRERVFELISAHYLAEYELVFGPISDTRNESDQVTRVFVNSGKAIAAFVRTVVPQESPFDRYARALSENNSSAYQELTPEQTNGLRLFIGKAKCVNCHNGPMLTNGEFHHAGIPDEDEPDRGRAAVIGDLLDNEFGYFSQWSDADPNADGEHLRFLDQRATRYERAFKTPSLRNVAVRPPYMHAGQFATLSEVLRNYRDVPGQGLADELFHADLTDEELKQLEAFLSSLTSKEIQ